MWAYKGWFAAVLLLAIEVGPSGAQEQKAARPLVVDTIGGVLYCMGWFGSQIKGKQFDVAPRGLEEARKRAESEGYADSTCTFRQRTPEPPASQQKITRPRVSDTDGGVFDCFRDTYGTREKKSFDVAPGGLEAARKEIAHYGYADSTCSFRPVIPFGPEGLEGTTWVAFSAKEGRGLRIRFDPGMNLCYEDTRDGRTYAWNICSYRQDFLVNVEWDCGAGGKYTARISKDLQQMTGSGGNVYGKKSFTLMRLPKLTTAGSPSRRCPSEGLP